MNTPLAGPCTQHHPPAASLPLDPGFRPLHRLMLDYEGRAARDPGSIPVGISLEGSPGVFTTWRGRVLPDAHKADEASTTYLQHVVKFLLWARGGGTLHVAAPEGLQRHLAHALSPAGTLQFDAGLMARAYERPFDVRLCRLEDLPSSTVAGERLGGHRDGCRLGFDLGASDYKVAAVRNGEPVFSAEFPWKPVTEPDPEYHYRLLNEGLRAAAEHLPRVEAIGGSSAGIVVNNRMMVASLFRAVPADVFDRQVKPIFQRLQAEWKVPLAVANDGDVTALAGSMAWNRNGILGIAMGSSEAAGYIDPEGRILGWLNELAFAPVDARPDASRDEWSGAPGVGARYFSQQAVARLAPTAGITLPPDMPLPEQLVEIQRLATQGDGRAEKIFETIGGYLGYTLPLYHHFYDFRDVLVLGRVTSGRGGEVLVAAAHCVLQDLYGEAGPPFHVRVPDEKSRRVGQAVAAASLPPLKGNGS